MHSQPSRQTTSLSTEKKKFRFNSLCIGSTLTSASNIEAIVYKLFKRLIHKVFCFIMNEKYHSSIYQPICPKYPLIYHFQWAAMRNSKIRDISFCSHITDHCNIIPIYHPDMPPNMIQFYFMWAFELKTQFDSIFIPKIIAKYKGRNLPFTFAHNQSTFQIAATKLDRESLSRCRRTKTAKIYTRELLQFLQQLFKTSKESKPF